MFDEIRNIGNRAHNKRMQPDASKAGAADAGRYEILN